MYPEPRVTKLIQENFVPARFHVKEQGDAFQRFGAQWTPTVLIDDSEGNERHRIEGFLPADDFLAQLEEQKGDWIATHVPLDQRSVTSLREHMNRLR